MLNVRKIGPSQWGLFDGGMMLASSADPIGLERVANGLRIGVIPRSNPSERVGTRRRDAERLYTAFTGHRVTWDQIIELPHLDTAMAVGPCLDISYRTRRDGKIENYRHEFAERSRPLLAVSADGATALLLGGRFRFTRRGFEDF